MLVSCVWLLFGLDGFLLLLLLLLLMMMVIFIFLFEEFNYISVSARNSAPEIPYRNGDT